MKKKKFTGKGHVVSVGKDMEVLSKKQYKIYKQQKADAVGAGDAFLLKRSKARKKRET